MKYRLIDAAARRGVPMSIWRLFYKTAGPGADVLAVASSV